MGVQGGERGANSLKMFDFFTSGEQIKCLKEKRTAMVPCSRFT